MNKKHILHLYWRAGFGLLPKQLDLLAVKSKEQIINDLFLESKKISPLRINTTGLDAFKEEILKKSPEVKKDYNILNANLMKKKLLINGKFLFQIMRMKIYLLIKTLKFQEYF